MGFESFTRDRGRVTEKEAKQLLDEEHFSDLRERVRQMTSLQRKEAVSSLHVLRSRVEAKGVGIFNTLDKVLLYGLTPLSGVAGLALWALAGPFIGLSSLALTALSAKTVYSDQKKKILQRIDTLLAAAPQEQVAKSIEAHTKVEPLNPHEVGLFIDKKSFAEIQEGIARLSQNEKQEFVLSLRSLRDRVEKEGVRGLTGLDKLAYGTGYFSALVGMIGWAIIGPLVAVGQFALASTLLLDEPENKTKVLERIDKLIKMIEEESRGS